MTLCLVHGADQRPDGRINEEAKGRCDKAIALYRQREIKRIFITCHSQRGNRSLAEGMKNYFIGRGVRQEHVIVKPRGANTAGEIDVFRSLVLPREEVATVSSWYHIPRIFLIWLLRGKVIRCYAYFGPARFRDVIREIPATFNNLLRPKKSSKVLHAQ